MVRVTVSITTYNQARFIEKALESVASQVAPFDYEILIGDDGSDDGTSALVDEFARQHEGPIRVFHRVRAAAAQSGLMNFESGRRNYWANMRAARGEFIAHLDGDDYWCSSDKLARQVRQLESTPRLSACFAAARVVDADGRDLGRVLKPSSTSEIFSLNDLLMDNPANSPTLMFRKSAIAVHHDWFDRMPGVFWPTLVACALSGDIGFEDHITGCYRLHGSAVHSGRSKVRKTEWSLLGRLELRGGLPRESWPTLEAAIGVWQTRLDSAIRDANAPRGLCFNAWRYMLRRLRRVRAILGV